MRAAFTATIISGFLVAALPVAHAEDKAVARAAYAEGTKYYDLNNFEAALKAFEKAYWNYEEPAFLFNIAQCYRQLDRKPEAVRFYRSYLRKVPDAPNRTDVEKVVAVLEAAIAKETKPPIAIEPRLAAPAPSTGTTTAPPTTQTLMMARPAAAASSRRPICFAGIGVAVVGVAGVGLGAAFAALASDANHQFLHPADGVYSPTADQNRGTYQTAEVVVFTVGGAALVAGTTMYLVGRRR